MDRRQFLKLSGGGLVATATAAEVGLWAEFMSWLQRKPVWSFPSKSKIGEYVDYVSFSDVIELTDIPNSAVYYDKIALKNLENNLVFKKWMQVVNIPPTTGYKISLHRGPIPSA